MRRTPLIPQRWLAGVLVAPLVCTMTPTPAFGLRAGLEEKVERELGAALRLTTPSVAPATGMEEGEFSRREFLREVGRLQFAVWTLMGSGSGAMLGLTGAARYHETHPVPLPDATAPEWQTRFFAAENLEEVDRLLGRGARVAFSASGHPVPYPLVIQGLASFSGVLQQPGLYEWLVIELAHGSPTPAEDVFLRLEATVGGRAGRRAVEDIILPPWRATPRMQFIRLLSYLDEVGIPGRR